MSFGGGGVIDQVAKKWSRAAGGVTSPFAKLGGDMMNNKMTNRMMSEFGLGKMKKLGGSGTIANPFANSRGTVKGFGGIATSANPFQKHNAKGTSSSNVWGSLGLDMSNEEDFNNRYNPQYIKDKRAASLAGDGSSGGNSSGIDGLSGVKQWSALLDRASKETGVPWDVLAAIMDLESGGNVDADHAGVAVGLMAIVPEYWQELANKFGGDLTDPYTNIRVGAEILKQNYERFGDWGRAATAYFNGTGDFSDAQDAFGTTGKAYYDRFMSLWDGYKQYEDISDWNQIAPSATKEAENAMNLAYGVQGTEYVWGGEDVNGFDCSGLWFWAFQQQGISLPRTAADQYKATQRISADQLQPGDLIFFNFPADLTYDGQGGINHVAMYVGNGKILQATSNGGVVKTQDITPFYSDNIYGYGRV